MYEKVEEEGSPDPGCDQRDRWKQRATRKRLKSAADTQEEAASSRGSAGGAGDEAAHDTCRPLPSRAQRVEGRMAGVRPTLGMRMGCRQEVEAPVHKTPCGPTSLQEGNWPSHYLRPCAQDSSSLGGACGPGRPVQSHAVRLPLPHEAT